MHAAAPQVDEALDRKRQEELQATRESKFERYRLAQEEKAELLRRQELEKTNALRRAALKADLQMSLRLKEIELAKEQEAEMRAVEEANRVRSRVGAGAGSASARGVTLFLSPLIQTCPSNLSPFAPLPATLQVLEAAEARRLADVEARAAKIKAAYERGGGAALSAGLAEKARADEERANRLQAEYEAEMDAKATRERERRREETKERINTLKAQMAEREAARRAEEEAQRLLKARLDAEGEAMMLRAKEEKETLKRSKAEQLSQMRSSMISEQKRRYHDYVHRIPDKDQWVHTAVLTGRNRGFANLSVPTSFPAVVPLKSS